MQRDKTGDTCAADIKQISIWLANKVLWRDIWLGKLTDPIIYKLTLNKLDLRQTSNKLSII